MSGRYRLRETDRSPRRTPAAPAPHFHMPQEEQCERAVTEYLGGLGRADCAARAIQALKSQDHGPDAWVLELQQLELEGILLDFLDACKATTVDLSPPEMGGLGTIGEDEEEDGAASPGSAISPHDINVLMSFYREHEPQFATESKCREVLSYYISQSDDGADWREALRSEYKAQKGIEPWEWYSTRLECPTTRSPPGASTAGASDRRMSISVDGLAFTIDMAAEAAKQSGSVAEEMFTVVRAPDTPTRSLKRGQSAELQLKVGQMNVQLFSGPKLQESWMYPDLRSWQYEDAVDGSRGDNGTLQMQHRSGATHSFSCSGEDGRRCCSLMEQHASVMFKAVRDRQMAEKEKRAADLAKMRGEYIVGQTDVLVRATKSLTSAQVAVVEAGERMTCLGAEIVNGKTRLHMTGKEVRVRGHGPQQIEGWASWKSNAGVHLFRKAPTAPAAVAKDETAKPAAPAAIPVTAPLVLKGTVQDKIDDTLIETCQDLGLIKEVLAEIEKRRYKHPSVKALQLKAMSLEEKAEQDKAELDKAASRVSAGRRMSVSQSGGVDNVVDMAASVAKEAGVAGEEIFSVTRVESKKGSNSSLQLKVGQMSVQLFDGPRMLESWIYASLGGWDYVQKKKRLVLSLSDARAGSPRVGSSSPKISRTYELGCTHHDGTQICKLMTDHATAMMQRQREEERRHLQNLKGTYTVVTPKGLLMRAGRSAESSKIGIIANGETLEAGAAVLTEGRTRVHVTGKAVLLDDGSREDLDGWVTLKNANGAELMVKGTGGVSPKSKSKSKRPLASPRSPAKGSRTIGSRRHSVASPAKASNPTPVKVREFKVDTEITEFRVKQTHIAKAAASVTLKCEPLALRVFDGTQCVSSYAYQLLQSWEVPPKKEPSTLLLNLVNGDKVTFEVRPGDGPKIAKLMSQHAEKLFRATQSGPGHSEAAASAAPKKSPKPKKISSLAAARRSSVAVGSGVSSSGMSRPVKRMNMNSAFMTQSNDDGTFVVKQKSPVVRDVTLEVHNFGMQMSVAGTKPVTYTYDRIPSWKLLPNGDLSLKIVTLGGDLEIFNFASSDANAICERLDSLSDSKGASSRDAAQETQADPQDLPEPGDRFECVDACAATAEWDRASTETGRVLVGQLIEVGEVTLNFQQQWRLRIRQAWTDTSAVDSVSILEHSWVSLRTVRGAPNFALLSDDDSRVAATSPTAANAPVEDAYWRETRLLEEATQRIRDSDSGPDTATAKPAAVSRTMKKPKKSKPTVAVEEVVTAPEATDEGPVSPRFLGDAVSAAKDWERDREAKLAELDEVKAALAAATTQASADAQKIAALEKEKAEQQRQLQSMKSGAGSARVDPTDDQSERMEELEEEKQELEMTVLNQLRQIHTLQHEVKQLGEELESASAAAGTADAASSETARLSKQVQLLKAQVEDLEQEKRAASKTSRALSASVANSAETELCSVEQQLEKTRSLERGMERLSAELESATVASMSAQAKVRERSAAHDAASERVEELLAAKQDLENTVSDQLRQIRTLQQDTELQQRNGELEELAATHGELIQKLQSELKQIRDGAVRSPRKSPATVAQDEIEELRLAVERNQRSADEAQSREQRAAADAASATGRLGLLLEEHQTLKDELHLQRSVVSQLNEQLAAQSAQTVRTADPATSSRADVAERNLATLQLQHDDLAAKARADRAARQELEEQIGSLRHGVSQAAEARKRVEEEARAGWERADAEAELRDQAEHERRTQVAEMQEALDEHARTQKKQQQRLEAESQRHNDAAQKVQAEIERARAAEMNAQHVASRARAASAEMRTSLVDIQSKYEKQLAALRVEKAKAEGSCEQAIQERQKLQEWVHDHMEATRERLLNSSAAVEAAESARSELHPRLAKAEAEAARLRDQLRRLARESAAQQQSVASKLEHLQATATAEQDRLKAQLLDKSAELDAQKKSTAVERSRREDTERRVASEVEAARLVEINSAHAIEDAKAQLETSMQQTELRIEQRYQQELEGLRLEKAKLEGQYEHSVRVSSPDCMQHLPTHCLCALPGARKAATENLDHEAGSSQSA